MRITDLYLAKGDAARALALLRDEAKKHPERADLRTAIGDTLARMDDQSGAVSEFEAVLAKVDPKSRDAAILCNRLGEAYRRGNKLEKALAAFQRAHEIMPEEPTVLNNVAVTLLQLDRHGDAKKLYEDTFRLQGDNPVALNNLAFLIAENQGDLDYALTLAQRARQKRPHSLEMADTVGWIYLKKNLPDNALEVFQDIVRKEPGNPTFRFHLGMALAAKGDRANAVKELQGALGNNPSRAEESKIRAAMSKLS
jgi:Flp pilus assembly protein TadD